MFHSLLGTDVFVVVLGNAKALSESIPALGQSGLIGPGSSDFDAHFSDELPLFTQFEYKPMHLFLNTQLKE